MSTKSVIQDERDAELRYQRALGEAKIQARLLADATDVESARIAALEAAAALERIEAARIAAAVVPADKAKPTFWDYVLGKQ